MADKRKGVDADGGRTPEMKGLVERIDQAMKARNIKQGPLAKALGTGQPTISDWIRGEKVPGAENILKLPAALNVDGHWLLTGEGQMDRVEESEAAKLLALVRVVVTGGGEAMGRLPAGIARAIAELEHELNHYQQERDGVPPFQPVGERRRNRLPRAGGNRHIG